MPHGLLAKTALWLPFCALLVAGAATARAQDAEAACGSPPPMIDESIVAEIEGEFSGVRWLDVGGKGRYEQRSEEILSRYPNADRLLLEYVAFRALCIVLMGDGDMTQQEKIETLRDMRRDILGQGASGRNGPSAPDDRHLTGGSFLAPVRQWHRAVPALSQETREIRLIASLPAQCRGPEGALDALAAFAPDKLDVARPAVRPEGDMAIRLEQRRVILDLYDAVRVHALVVLWRQMMVDQPFAMLRCNHEMGVLFDLRVVPCHRGTIAPNDAAMMEACGLDEDAMIERQVDGATPAVCYQARIRQSMSEALVRQIRPVDRAIETALFEGGPGVSAFCLEDASTPDPGALLTVLFAAHDHRYVAPNLLAACFYNRRCSVDAFDPAVSPPSHPDYG